MSGSAPPPDLRCAFALLAAGQGARFGGGKLLADLCGKPLWRWAIDAAAKAGFRELHVVTNDPAVAAESAASGWTVHPNPAAESGMASSIVVAASATASTERTVLALADMPFVEAEHLRRLAEADGVAFTCYPDRTNGVPAAFPRAARERLLRVAGNRGAGSLDWPDARAIEPPTAESLVDIDTPASLGAAQTIAFRRLRAAPR